ncbi:hypothetical protein [Leucobacter aridicollis]|uniref:Uncharacterized protein n=1 Tax=Leucobacter aridicollis TaxID=283878 RepID=A0A852QX42_9MICO|nr:hypothetical protein [Leucobacter aridicollis]MBL3682010.1 hypothetical protein [Leucobacter aridicollis]NYD26943.1 hypothetical protein [Leucobacter aridicollis]
MTTPARIAPGGESREYLVMSLSDLTGGNYLSTEDVCRELEITRSALNVLTHEQTHGGRGYGEKRADGEWEQKLPLSDRARLLPAPIGMLLRSLVWRGDEIRAIKDEFRALAPRRGRRAKSDK